jgi:hypothetical protein
VVEFSGMAGQGTDAEATTWIEAALRDHIPDLYDTEEVELDDLVDEIDDLAIEEDRPAPATPAASLVKKGPTPPTKDPLKQLNSAIKTAENAIDDKTTKKNLAFWNAESKKHSNNAREGAKEGASPQAVEDDMKVAATNESKLADKKTKIAKKFRKALEQMPSDHGKYEDFKVEMTRLTSQAAQHQANHDALLAEGEALRIKVSKARPPTHLLFHYLCDKQQIERVTLPTKRKELDSLDKDGKPRINARTGEERKDYIEEYVIKPRGAKEVVVHVHYGSMDAPVDEIVACHFKTWDQRHLGLQHEVNEDAIVYRSSTNLDMIYRLRAMAGKGMRQETQT